MECRCILLVSGKNFNKYGNSQNWWTAKSEEGFKSQTKCLVDQYSKYSLYNKFVSLLCIWRDCNHSSHGSHGINANILNMVPFYHNSESQNKLMHKSAIQNALYFVAKWKSDAW